MLVTGCGEDKSVDTQQSNVAPRRNNVNADTSDIETLDEPAVEPKIPRLGSMYVGDLGSGEQNTPKLGVANVGDLEIVGQDIKAEPLNQKFVEQFNAKRKADEAQAAKMPTLFEGTPFAIKLLNSLEKEVADELTTNGKTPQEVNWFIRDHRKACAGSLIDKSELITIEKGSPLQPEDLSFGAIYLGDSYEYVISRLGDPDSMSSTIDSYLKYSNLICRYNQMYIGFKDNKVIEMASVGQPPGIMCTKRGIYPNFYMYMKDVVAIYGRRCRQFVDGGYIVIEYPIMSKENRPAVLRFEFKQMKDSYTKQFFDENGQPRLFLFSDIFGDLMNIIIRYE